MEEQFDHTIEQSVRSKHTGIIIGAAVLFVLIGICVGGVVAYGAMSEDEVAKGLLVGDIPVGGMSETEVTEFVGDMVEKLLTSNMEIQAETPSGTMNLYLEPVIFLSSDGTAKELVQFDETAIINQLLGYGKDGNRFEVGWNLLTIRFNQPSVQIEGLTISAASIIEELETRTAEVTTEPTNASIDIISTRPIDVDITPSANGNSYDFKSIVGAVEDAYAVFTIPTATLEPIVTQPDIVASDLQLVTSTITTVLEQFPMQIVYSNTTTGESGSWTIFPERAAELLQPKRNGKIYLGVHEDRFLGYLSAIIAPSVEVAPKNARFSMEDGRVSEFQGARDGIGIATSSMVLAMDEAIIARNNADAAVSSTLPLVVVAVEPEVDTEDVNDLGIKELLGVGVSDFSGSPANRIGNIRNAVNKLNGLIIAPGEEFSTIEHTKPYTIAGGYLPEKVIKGDSIEPEIGGGLCQIGTTLFRMAMNSGLEITERRNHSLVVNYYNDLENGLPGTDATLYDPAPDFKFKNDTENYILIEASMDVYTGMLRFYLWGTSDGRTASFSRPQVLEWYSPDEPRYIETMDLDPGVTECQSAFRGAFASFTYTRQLPGEQEPQETVYTSRYRALPKICLIGVEEKTQCQEIPDGSTSCNAEETGTETTEEVEEVPVPTA